MIAALKGKTAVRPRPKRIDRTDASLREEAPVYAIQMRWGEGYFRGVQGIPPTGDFLRISERLLEIEAAYANSNRRKPVEFRIVRYDPVEIKRVTFGRGEE